MCISFGKVNSVGNAVTRDARVMLRQVESFEFQSSWDYSFRCCETSRVICLKVS